MTDKTEAQPEALRLATLLDVNYHEPYVEQAAATELRRQHGEIERLRALAATCYAGLAGECDLPVIWLDALNDAANGEPFDTDGLLPYTSAIRAQLTTQTNRAAAAEQQVIALTQRLDMVNRLNTDAREELADLKPERDFYKHRCDALQAAQSTMRDPERTVVCDILANGHLLQDGSGKPDASRYAQLSARQAAPDGWRLVPVEPTEEMLDAAHEGDREYTLRVFGDVMTVMQGPHDHYVAMLSAAPQPPEREPLKGDQ